MNEVRILGEHRLIFKWRTIDEWPALIDILKRCYLSGEPIDLGLAGNAVITSTSLEISMDCTSFTCDARGVDGAKAEGKP